MVVCNIAERMRQTVCSSIEFLEDKRMAACSIMCYEGRAKIRASNGFSYGASNGRLHAGEYIGAMTLL